MSAGFVLYGILGFIAFGLLIFLLTPAGRRWVEWLGDK